MAQSLFQPVLSPTQTPTYINPGVVDESTASLIKGVGNLIPGAVTMYEEKSIAKALKDVDQDTRDYQENYEGWQIEDKTAGSMRIQADAIWDKLGNQDTTDPDGTTASLNGLEGRLTKYTKARQQGRITEQEYLARVTQSTREAVNKNPWLEQELYSRVQGHLKATGVADVIDARIKGTEDAAKVAEDEYKFLRNQLSTRGLLHHYTPGMSMEQMTSVLQADDQRTYTHKVYDDFLKNGKVIDEIEGRRMLDDGSINKVHQVDLDKAMEATVKLLDSDPSPTTYASAIAALERTANTRVNSTVTSLGRLALSDAGKQHVELVRKNWDTLIQTVKDAGSGANAKEYMANLRIAQEDAQKYNLGQRFDLPALDLAFRGAAAFGTSFQKQIYQAGGKKVESVLGTIVDLIAPDQAGTKKHQDAVFSGQGNALLSSVFEKMDTLARDDGPRTLEAIVVGTNKAVFNAAQGGEVPKEGYVALNGMLATIAQNASKVRGAPVSPVFSQGVNTAVQTVMGKTIPNLRTTIDKLHKANPGLKIDFDILPNGSFVINTGHPDADVQFATKFGNVVNNALDAYAAATGQSREQAAKEFYPKYFSQVVYDAGYTPPQNAPEGSVERLSNPVGSPTSDLKPEGVPLPTPEEIKPPVAPPVEPKVEEDPMEEIKKLSNMFRVSKERFKKGEISKEEYDMRVDLLNKRRKELYPDGKLFPYEEVPDKKSSVDTEGMVKYLESTLAELSKPRTILRDENGRITGVA